MDTEIFRLDIFGFVFVQRFIKDKIYLNSLGNIDEIKRQGNIFNFKRACKVIVNVTKYLKNKNYYQSDCNLRLQILR